MWKKCEQVGKFQSIMRIFLPPYSRFFHLLVYLAPVSNPDPLKSNHYWKHIFCSLKTFQNHKHINNLKISFHFFLFENFQIKPFFSILCYSDQCACHSSHQAKQAAKVYILEQQTLSTCCLLCSSSLNYNLWAVWAEQHTQYT